MTVDREKVAKELPFIGNDRYFYFQAFDPVTETFGIGAINTGFFYLRDQPKAMIQSQKGGSDG